jgi:carboxyl-terminal processing protease
VIGKDNKVLKTLSADPSKAIFEGKVAVLIDLGTAGAAEVVASAILDRKRGEVVGERSFGSGTSSSSLRSEGERLAAHDCEVGVGFGKSISWRRPCE